MDEITESRRGLIGAPSKKTPINVDRVLKGFRLYGSQKAASAYAGLASKTIARWIEEDQEFAEAVDLAKNNWERQRLKAITFAGRRPGGWQANAWLLERTRPADYSLAGQGARVSLGDSQQIPQILAVQIQNLVIGGGFSLPSLPQPSVPSDGSPEGKGEGVDDDDVIDVPPLPSPRLPAPEPIPVPVPVFRSGSLLAAAGKSRL